MYVLFFASRRNTGDSRCLISTGTPNCAPDTPYNCVTMTDDHIPTIPEENLRIMKAGGFVQDDRVDGSLAMSRAMGDFR